MTAHEILEKVPFAVVLRVFDDLINTPEFAKAKERKRMIFIYRSSPRLCQKIVLRQLAEADTKRKSAIKSHILTGSPATV